MTKEVEKALMHVRQYHPKIDTVLFLKDGSWICIESETHNVPFFEEGVDAAILEVAADSLDNLPKIFQL